MRYPLIATLLCLSFSGWADERIVQIPQHMCSNVDIREVNPALKEPFSTPRNQGPIGWCYGFAAADLLTEKLGTHVSAAHVSAIYNRWVAGNLIWRIGYGIGDLFTGGELDDFYEGGFISKALKKVESNKAVCSEMRLPYDPSYFGEYRDVLLGLEALKDQLQKKTISEEDARVALFTLIDQRIIPDVDHEKLVARLKKNNLNKVLAELLAESCQGHELAVPKLKVVSRSKPGLNHKSDDEFDRSVRRIGKFYQELNQTLDAGKPVGISYAVKHITDSGGSHASVIMARRWHQGQCEYKIRNSWGRGCHSYKAGIDCDSAEGSFWVSDDTLYKMSQGITYLE